MHTTAMTESGCLEKTWTSFCGTPNSCHEVDSYSNWTKVCDLTTSTCGVNSKVAWTQATDNYGINSLIAGIHSMWFLLFCLSLGFIGWGRGRPHGRYLLRYPGHCLKWIITFFLGMVLLASIAEGVLTDATYRATGYTTQLHLYIPAIITLLSLGASLAFYHMMEVWRIPKMAFVLVTYWMASMAADIQQLLSLVNLNMNGQSVTDLMRFNLILCRLAFYFVLLIVELNLIRQKVSVPGINNSYM